MEKKKFKDQLKITTKKEKKSIIACSIIGLINAIITAFITSLIPKVFTNEWSDYFLLVVFSNLFIIFGDYITTVIEQKIELRVGDSLNNILAEKLQKIKLSFYSNNNSGKIISLFADLWNIAVIPTTIINISYHIVKLLISLVIIYTFNPKACLAMIIISLIVTIVYMLFQKKIGKMTEKISEFRQLRNSIINDMVYGAEVIRHFNASSKAIEEFSETTFKFTLELIKKKVMKTKLNSFIDLSSMALDVTIMILGIKLIINGKDPSIAYTLIMYASRIFYPLMDAVNIVAEVVGDILPSWKIVTESFDYEDEDDTGRITLNSFNNSIELKNIGFSYNESDDVLKDISFTIKKGQKIGICGPSGSGKTSLIKLLNRSENPTEGSIYIDGIDIKEITLKSLRSHIGLVSQNNFCFDNTVRYNIAYGNPDATETEIVEASRKANCEEFIHGLSSPLPGNKVATGYNANIGPNGAKLSGGQKQRINIARLFLSNPDILIMDEATSALDNISERLIKKSIDELSKDKTVIFIAHRLTTLKSCNKIYVIDSNHRIVESGNYNQLMELGGLFTKMAKSEEK